jgi:hypothetical protein
MAKTAVYVGNDPAALTAYNNWVGKAPSLVVNYLNNDSWSGFDSSAPYEASLWKGAAAPSIWSVPLTVWGTSLEQVATGAYNSHFLAAAQELAQTAPSSDGSIYIRVGWEYNGSWMPWASEGHEAAFAQSFQNFVNTFRSVSSKFKFVLDVNAGGNVDPAKAYPGDKYVDVIGLDDYYNTQWFSSDPNVAFSAKVAEQYGLQWHQDFAAAHGKATALSEWGVMSNNSGPYVQSMVKWISDHNMVYASYWDANAGGYNGKLSNGQYPDAGAAYKAAIQSLQGSVAVAPAPVSSPPISSPSSSTDTLVLKMSGDSYQGTPHFIVTVDGQQVGGTLTTSAAHASGQTQDITLTGNFGAGAHDVAVKFIDDVYGGSSAADRNLYLHQISLNGQVQAGSTSTNTAGSNSNGVANMLSNGTATFHTGGTDTLVFKVSGDSYQGTPHFIVTVDGQQVGGTLTTSAAHASGQTQDITLTGNFGSGTHDVAVKFIDDVYGGSSAADRNLYVHQISLNGQVQAGSTSDNTAGPNSNGVANLWNSGTATFHTGGTDTLVFKVSGDSYQGTPHFLVTVDGQQVGGTLTTSAVHASGQTQDITLTGNFGAGAHDVAVKFIDDAWGGSAATDRNLYVHQVSLNGHIQAGDLADNHAGMNTAGVANLLSNGTADWHM